MKTTLYITEIIAAIGFCFCLSSWSEHGAVTALHVLVAVFLYLFAFPVAVMLCAISLKQIVKELKGLGDE